MVGFILYMVHPIKLIGKQINKIVEETKLISQLKISKGFFVHHKGVIRALFPATDQPNRSKLQRCAFPI